MHTNAGANPRSVCVCSLYCMATATTTITTTEWTRATHFQISFGTEAAATLVPSPKPKRQAGTVPQFSCSTVSQLSVTHFWYSDRYADDPTTRITTTTGRSSSIPRKLTRKQRQRSHILTRADSWHTDAYLEGGSFNSRYICHVKEYTYICSICIYTSFGSWVLI